MRIRSILLAAFASLLTLAMVAHAQVPGVNSTLQTVFTYMFEPSTNKATYRASGLVTAPTSASDIVTIWGSATKIIRVRHISFSANVPGVALTEPVYIIKRSTADTAGTSAIVTAVPLTATSAAATAVVESYSAVPTLGTFIGEVAVRQVAFPIGTTGGLRTEHFDFGKLGSPVLLNAAAQQLSINLGTVTTSAIVAFTVEWTEE